MPDLLKIKRNVSKMVTQGAPEADIDAYIQGSGTTIDDIRDTDLGLSGVETIGESPSLASKIKGRTEKVATEVGKKVHTEILGPIAHAGSAFAFGAPKAIAEKIQPAGAKLVFPEQKTEAGKILRATGEIIGFTTGGAVKGGQLLLKAAKKAVPKLAGKGLLKTAVRGGIAGVTAGALQTPEEGEGILKPEERLKQAKTWGLIGVAAPFAVKGVTVAGKTIAGITTKTGRWIAKNIGGVSDATVKVIKRLGAERVFDPLKAKTDYIGKAIVPKVRDRTINLITKFNPKSKAVLKAIGMKPEEIDTLSKVDKSKLAQLKNIFGEDWNSIKGGLEKIKSNADLQFKTTLQKQPPGKLLDVKDTFYKLKSMLVKQGWIDKTGNERIGAGIANKTKTNLIKIFKDLERGLVTEGKVRATGKINTQEYFNKLSELEASVSGNPKFDRMVFATQESLRKSASKGVKGLTEANKAYSDATKLLDMEKSFTKFSDPIHWEKQLLQLRNPAKFNLHEKFKTILGPDLYDDLMAHLANQDFELVSDIPAPAGGFYPSKAGVLRGAITRGAKKYYQLSPGARKIVDKIGKTIQPLKEPFKEIVK